MGQSILRFIGLFTSGQTQTMLISSLHELLAEELLLWIGLGLGIEIPQNVTQHQYLDTLIWIRTHTLCQ